MEVEKHEDGWPFLQPVSCKQFTSYRKFLCTVVVYRLILMEIEKHEDGCHSYNLSTVNSLHPTESCNVLLLFAG